MKFPKIEFADSLDKQAEYICFLAKGIQQGSYQNLGFLVLPYPVPKNRISVFFPKLPYSNQFWQAITKCRNENLGETFPRECIEEVEIYLKANKRSASSKRNQAIIAKWKKTEKKIFSLVKDFLDLEKIISQVAKIEILLTNFGTCGSFYPYKLPRPERTGLLENSFSSKLSNSVYKKNDQIQIIVTHRKDFPVSEIARTLLLCLYRIKTKRKMIKGLPWWQRKAVVDYLLGETSFHRLFPDYQTPKEILDDKKADKLVAESQNFLAELGFPQQSIINLDKKENLTIEGKDLSHAFTNQENRILRALAENRSQAVSYDQLAELLWGPQADEKFSLYAIAKVIENLRRKLMETGIYQNLIVTVRRQGYLLKD